MDSAANKSEQEISLKDLFINIKQWGVYLFSKWYILLIAGFFGAGIGILYSKVKNRFIQQQQHSFWSQEKIVEVDCLNIWVWRL